MDKRFALSAAGIAGATATAAFAGGDAVVTIHGDYYLGEGSMNMASTGGNSIGFFVSGGSLFFTSSGSIISGSVGFGLWDALASSPYTSGYKIEYTLANATGDYTVAMGDTWGDGWAWASCTGLDAFVATGDVSGSTTIGFSSGSSAGGSLSITPAPGALALLGLAGLAGRRKRA